MPLHALLVEPDIAQRVLLSSALAAFAQVCTPEDFFGARQALMTESYDLLVANIRLGAHNGLHLVHLVNNPGTRSVVYAAYHDLCLARTAQALGAFYERSERMPIALPGYATGPLPPIDRRNPATVDRRCAPVFRGGRRSADRSTELMASLTVTV